MPFDRNLLFGILALQMDFISKDALIAALHAWVLDKAKPLGQILHEQGRLARERRQLLEALVEEHLKAHQDDAQQSLAAVSPTAALRQELQAIADDEVQASLAQVPAGARDQASSTVSFHAAGEAGPESRYRILRPHARGGLGEVFVAEDTELHREVALKEIRQEHAADAISRGRFVLEAEITGGLEHPGIVPVYGLGTYADGRPFYAMRFIKGDNLKEAIERFHSYSPPREQGPTLTTPSERNVAFRELLGRFVDVCNAVAYAHSRGILHRDLKPGNILLGKYGETLVVDWGLAKVLGKDEGGRMKDEKGPKIDSGTSFILHPSSLPATRVGSAVGTPSFMSPEQAAGRLDHLGPASDIFSLGATLYMLLTGQPPFTGDMAEVLRRVQRGDFVPPRALQAEVPAALEAVCLKAMALQPRDRYPTALELAVDIEHWLADEPVSAWSEPVSVRLRRWARQHRPLVSGAAAALLVALLALGGGSFWYAHEQGRRALEQQRAEQGVVQALQQASDARQQLHKQLHKPGGVFELLNRPGDWQGQIRMAQASLRHAKAVAQSVEGLSGEALVAQIEELEAQLGSDEQDRALAVALEKIRLDVATLVKGAFDDAGAMKRYGPVFARAKLPVEAGSETAVAQRIQQSAIGELLLAALDDWARSAWRTGRHDLARRLLHVARQADADPWRKQLHDPQLWEDPHGLELRIQAFAAELKAQAPTRQLSPQMWDLVGVHLPLKAREKWLRQAQELHPTDFWLNYHLANTLAETGKQPEAIGFYRAALVLRPQSSAVHNNLGTALLRQNDLDGAIRHYRKALQFDPNDALHHNNLGLALAAQNDLEAAIGHYKKALQLNPNYASAHFNLGTALQDQQDLIGAMHHYERALELNPNDARAHNSLGTVLRARQDLEGAIKHYQKALQLNPNYADPHNNLGNVLHAQNDLAGAIKHFQAALQIDPSLVLTHHNLGFALYDQKNLTGAIRHFKKAVELDPNYAHAHFGLGAALCDARDFDGAIRHFRKGLQLNPNDPLGPYNLANALYHQKDLAGAIVYFKKALQLRPNLPEAHCNLGHALREQGDFAAALPHLRRGHQLGSQKPGWPHPSAQWISQCQRLLKLDSRCSAILKGQVQPKDAAEQLELANLCRRYKKMYAAAARFYAGAFAAAPSLAEDLSRANRYHAACAAALAARLEATDGAAVSPLDAAAKRLLRRQALDWLHADLAKWRALIERRRVKDILAVLELTLPKWQSAPELACVREAKELARLSPEEQWDWQRLWSDVEELQQQARACFRETRLPGNLTDRQKAQVHELKLSAGKSYIVDLESKDFDTVLRLEDVQGTKLAVSDNSPPEVNRNVRLIFTPAQDGTYRLVATSFQQWGTGAYVLRIREFVVRGGPPANARNQKQATSK
jgi:tetratricopeptide (TPR) repeat protein/tRNA A-37 threonylcarbamoyl transferase component Bud32